MKIKLFIVLSISLHFTCAYKRENEVVKQIAYEMIFFTFQKLGTVGTVGLGTLEWRPVASRPLGE